MRSGKLVSLVSSMALKKKFLKDSREYWYMCDNYEREMHKK